MSLWKSRSCTLFLHRHEVALYTRDGSGGLQGVCRQPVDSFSDADGVGAAVAACLAKLPPRHHVAEVVFDDSHARFWLVVPPKGLSRLRDLKSVAILRFETLFELPTHEWHVEADWHASREFLACALPTALLAQIVQLPHLSVPLHCHPYFIQQWNLHARRLNASCDAFAVVGDEAMTLSLLHEGALRAVHRFALPALDAPELTKVADALHALCLQIGCAAPSEVVLAGNVPSTFTDASTSGLRWRPLAVN